MQQQVVVEDVKVEEVAELSLEQLAQVGGGGIVLSE